MEARPRNSPNWRQMNDYACMDPCFTVTNLPEGGEFEFRVIAVNAAGQSEPSFATAPILIKDNGMPSYSRSSTLYSSVFNFVIASFYKKGVQLQRHNSFS